MSKQTKTNLEILAFSLLIGFLSGVGMLASCSAQAQEASVVLPPDAPFVAPDLATIVQQSAYSVVIVVLAVEVLRWLVPGFKRKKGQPLAVGTRFAILGIALLSGVCAGLYGVAPAVSPGIGGKLSAGFVAFALGLTFNETVMAALRHAISRKQKNGEAAP